jgi:hypothetical protein
MPHFNSTRLGRRAACAFAWIVSAACGEEPPAQNDTALTVAPAAERLAGTPEGGLHTWVQDIRSGTNDLAERFRQDPKEAEKTAVDLYVNRQEWLERYWGTYGVLTQSVAPELGQAVMDAEARFHELLTVLTGSDATAVGVDEAVQALDRQLELVVEKSQAANVPLSPPGETPASGGER